MDSRVVTALVVAGGLAIFGLLLVVTAMGELRGRRRAKVPAAFRPGPSDEELERNVLERTMLYAGLTTIFVALWIPAYWWREPVRMDEKRVKFEQQALEEGEEIYAQFCAECHGREGEGQPRQVTVDGRELRWAEPPLKFMYDRYQAAGRNDQEITQILYDTINRGRPGTPMPTWGLAFGGPLNSAQVDNLVRFIQEMQEHIVPGPRNEAFRVPEGNPDDGAAIYLANCAVCHNAPDEVDAMQADPSRVRALAGLGGVGPNLQVALQRHPLRCPSGQPLCQDSIEHIIEYGRLNTNRASMPAWAALGDEAIDALLRFIQSIQRG